MVTQRAAGLQQVRVHLAQHSNLSCLLSFSITYCPLSFPCHSFSCSFHLNSYMETKHVKLKNGTSVNKGWSGGFSSPFLSCPLLRPLQGPSSDLWALRQQFGNLWCDPTFRSTHVAMMVRR